MDKSIGYTITMEWSNEVIFQLIDGYRERSVLWDPEHMNYKNISVKNQAWHSLAQEFNVDVMELKRKINSLLASYRRERQKIIKSQISSRTNTFYKSTWFAFNSLSFLTGKYKPKNVDISKNEGIGEYEESFAEVDEMMVDIKNVKTENNPERSYVDEVLINGIKTENPYFNEVLIDENQNNDQITPEIEHETSSVDSKEEPSNLFVQKKISKRKRMQEDPRINEAYKILKNISTKRQVDECSTYGEYVSHVLRKLDNRSRVVAQHMISNILYEAEMGKYNSDVEETSTSLHFLS